MATNVFANGHEISCKAAKGKTSVAFPDACWSPPPPPAGPIVLPYPNMSKPSKLKKGTRTVVIKNSMVALEDRSYFSSSNGNEPATQAFQKGLLTRKIKGKTYYKKWSMNVKFEGKGVCRNVDIMTHNHGSFPGNTATFPYLSTMTGQAAANDKDCADQKKAIEDNCKSEDGKHWTESKQPDKEGTNCEGLEMPIMSDLQGAVCLDSASSESIAKMTSKQLQDALKKPSPTADYLTGLQTENACREAFDKQTQIARSNDCLNAKKCELVPYETNANNITQNNMQGSKNKSKAKSTKLGCCPGQTGHHLIYDSMMEGSGCNSYKTELAPVVCAEGSSHFAGSHGKLHEKMGRLMKEHLENSGPTMSMNEAIDAAAQSHKETFPDIDCGDCVKAQLKNYYDQCASSRPKVVQANGREINIPSTPNVRGK